MRTKITFLKAVPALLLVSLATPSSEADGYLWIGAEFAQEGHLYRYDIGSGQLDVDCAVPLSGNSHWNNVAVDGASVYIGSPLSDYIGIVDTTPLSSTSCDLTGSTTYSAALGGHKEDGAYHPGTGRLWRVTYTGSQLHETETDGTLVNTYSISGISAGLVGLAWVGDRLFATDYDGTGFGELVFGQTSVTWHPISWGGTAPPASLGALAYDRQDGVLYMIAGSRHLYTVSIDDQAGTAEATPIVQFETLGYPAAALADGMGWVARECTESPVQITLQPTAAALPVGSALTLDVVATGTAPLTYRWRRGGVPLVDGGTVFGATTPTLTVDPLAATDAGLYDCVVSGVCGPVTSDTALVTVGNGTNASGYLWLGAEYAGEGAYYRYDLAGNVIDRVCSGALPPGAEHWNNMATDGRHLYLGSPNHQLLARVSAYNCDPVTEFTYAPELTGRLEDGAYRDDTDTLWRLTFNGQLHETSRDGLSIRTYDVPPGLVGLTWADTKLYATSHDLGSIGEITLGAPPAATHTPIPWDGPPPLGTIGALAHDPMSGVVYLTTSAGALYSITLGAGLATATLIQDLTSVGYPSGALPDGLGFIGACPAPGGLGIQFAGDKATLGWAAIPGATYDVISGSFSKDLSTNNWTGAGGILQTTNCRVNDSSLTTFDTVGLEPPTPNRVSMWLVRACAGTWNAGGAVDRDLEILCP